MAGASHVSRPTPAASDGRWPPSKSAGANAPAEDRIRCLKDIGLHYLPVHSYHANRVWLEVVALAGSQVGTKALRFRLLTVAG
jgi:hypothetical protein